MEKAVIRAFEESAALKQVVAKQCVGQIVQSAERICKSLREEGKVLIFGNGGSAADAQHIAAELIGRFKKDRGALPAIALTTDTSILTCVGNDYGFEEIFSRQVEGLIGQKDVAIGISTSGASENVYRGIVRANEKGAFTIGLLGKDGGRIKGIVDCAIIVPSDETDRIQESHITIGHIICQLVEGELF